MFLLGLLCIVAGASASRILLDWPQRYEAIGRIQLPYAEINEPFHAWFSTPQNMARIDYYDGMVKTYMLASEGQYGLMYKIAPMTTETEANVTTCFNAPGTEEAPVSIQTVLPDTTDFQKTGTEIINGVLCDIWQKRLTVQEKVNIYTLWVSQADGSPLRYEMKGFDDLLGSHYDHYLIDYNVYRVHDKDFPSDIFKFNKSVVCRDFPGPGLESTYHMNPMGEYVNGDHSHVSAAFDRFRNHHKQSYQNKKEENNRLHNFRQNMRFIHSKNRAGLGYTLEMNHLADKTTDEIRYLRGYRSSNTYDPEALHFRYTAEDVAALPDQIDWRLYGAVTPVKDQAICGSCWSFGTTGTMEGTYFLKTGKLVLFSEQSLIDCSWGFGNDGCDGGEDYRAYRWIMKHGGIPTTETYGPYLGEDAYCHADSAEKLGQMTGYVNVTPGDLNALKVALATKGPISISIDASLKTFSFYSHGVYYDANCGNTEDRLDHSVLAVGYGVLHGEPYWLVKNSWSTHWGNDGYILMAQKDNNCGVLTEPTHTIM